ncbi:MAG: hypothetical protein KDD14_12895 [Saprospiraceae bacterium]|nr:hypothetical protein [Saprospiraceae bacterium]
MNNRTIKYIINGIAVLTMIAGAFGMLFCYPFLWSARIEDLVGAGFPFLAGAVLFGTGLITIGIFNKKDESN